MQIRQLVGWIKLYPNRHGLTLIYRIVLSNHNTERNRKRGDCAGDIALLYQKGLRVNASFTIRIFFKPEVIAV